MKSDMSPIALTIQDFVGALLPGMVWAVEFFTLGQIVRVFFHSPATSAICTSTWTSPGVLYPSTFQVALTLTSCKEPAFYTGFVVCSLILGYITSSFPTLLSEFVSFYLFNTISFCINLICCPVRTVVKSWRAIQDFRDKMRNFDPKDYINKSLQRGDTGKLFPYNATYLDPNDWLRPMLESYFLRNYGLTIDQFTGKYERSCFHLCKKFLRFNGPDYVRDRLMFLESQNRMLSSLLLASFANVILVLLALHLSTDQNNYDSLRAWLGFSAATMGVLCYTFHYRRRSEVSAVYNYMVIFIKRSSRISSTFQQI